MQLKPFTSLLLILPCFLVLCKGRGSSTNERITILPAANGNKNLTNVGDIKLPSGYSRTRLGRDHFSSWLTEIKLKKNKTVYLYNGVKKPNQDAQFAVLDIYVPNENLQQCADAIMRLRSEYLFEAKKYKEIKFYDNNGKLYQFTAPHTRDHLERYLHQVFGMCGTASLSKQLKATNIEDIIPGDVFIRGGFPGHAVIVMDVAKNSIGQKVYLLAQSYMPAQDIHILKNPANDENNPWYEVNPGKDIITPEYIFKKNELKGW